jgi:hypothetical protein
VRVVLVLGLIGCSFSARTNGSEPIKDASDGAPDDLIIIDAPDARVLADCPTPAANCTLLANTCLPQTSCYYRCTTNRNWEDARVRCHDDGMGCLVTLDDATENSCLSAALHPDTPSNRYWIGFTQTVTTVEPAGGWTWTCGTSTFTPSPPWGLPPPDNEPNDLGGNEDCAAVVNDAGHWIDADCDSTLDYVCEFPR